MNLDYCTTIGVSRPMVVMPSNNSGMEFGRLAGLFPNRIGWLMSPSGWRKPPDWLPFALDNGAYSAFSTGQTWDYEAFLGLLEKAKTHHRKPLWVVVPDVVQDADQTKRLWRSWADRIRTILPNVPLAFAVQNGMYPSDVPHDAQVVFVGGTTEWKWKTLTRWTSAFPVVHVGRANSERMLWMAHDAGAASCDGTGWARGGPERIQGLVRYLERSSGKGKRPQMVFDLQ